MKKLVFLARGKRSQVYSGKYKGKPAVFKVKREDSEADGTIEREYHILQILNRQGIGPKVYGFKDGMLIMEQICGQRILDFFGSASRSEILSALSEITKQLRRLDLLKLEKGELVNPYKHIIITKSNIPQSSVKQIDFERCVHRLHPKNLTQFSTFLISAKVNHLLALKGIFIIKERIMGICRKYKHKPTRENFNALKSEILQKGLASRVYYQASQIPRGKVSSYGKIARAIGSKAFRAVGQAMSKNPFWPIVPCHRVINNDLSLGGFASGVEKKIKLLKSEGIIIRNKKVAEKNFLI